MANTAEGRRRRSEAAMERFIVDVVGLSMANGIGAEMPHSNANFLNFLSRLADLCSFDFRFSDPVPMTSMLERNNHLEHEILQDGRASHYACGSFLLPPCAKVSANARYASAGPAPRS